MTKITLQIIIILKKFRIFSDSFISKREYSKRCRVSMQNNINNKRYDFFGMYNSIYGRLMSYIMLMVHNQTVAEDLLQETASIMWENFDHFQEGTNFAAWAISIARNKTLEYLRENRKTKKLFQDEFYRKLSLVAETSTNDYSLRVTALEECLKKLNERDKILINQRYKDNVSVKEISHANGWPTSTLYQRFSKIFGLLHVCISRSLARQGL